MGFVKIRAIIEKITLFGRALFKVRAKKKKKTPFLVGLWLGLGQKKRRKTRILV